MPELRMPSGEGTVVVSDGMAPVYRAAGWTLVSDIVAEPPAEAEPVAPPRAGKGSTVTAWRDYALALGVAHADDMTRDDYIAAVDALEGE